MTDGSGLWTGQGGPMVSAQDRLQPEGQRVVVPVRHPGRWVAVAVILLLVAMLVHLLAFNPGFHWGVVGHYLFNGQILSGLRLTIELTAISMALGVVIGTLLAVGRLSENPIISRFCWFYIWLFRGTPLIVQLLVWYYLSAVVRTVGLGVPFGATFVTFQTNSLISQFGAAILGLGLNEAAYSSEIIRAGIMSVGQGQIEAGLSLGMTPPRLMRRVILPQAMRIVVPPIGNEVIGMLKYTALVLVIALPDLLTSAQDIYDINLLQIPLLIVACIWYLVASSLLSIGQYFIERRLGRSVTGIGRAAGARG